MNTAFLFRRRTRQATTVVLLLLAVFTMLSAQQPDLHWWARQAKWIALAYVLLAMGLLIFHRTRLMFVCLGCSAAICLFFNEIQRTPQANQSLQNPPELEIKDSTSNESTPPHR